MKGYQMSSDFNMIFIKMNKLNNHNWSENCNESKIGFYCKHETIKQHQSTIYFPTYLNFIRIYTTSCGIFILFLRSHNLTMCFLEAMEVAPERFYEVAKGLTHF